MTATENYLDALRACLYGRDVRGVTAKAAKVAAGIPLGVAVAEITGAARIPLAVAEIPVGASYHPSPMVVVALADADAAERVAKVAEVVAAVVAAFCREWTHGEGGEA